MAGLRGGQGQPAKVLRSGFKRSGTPLPCMPSLRWYVLGTSKLQLHTLKIPKSKKSLKQD